MGGGSEGGSSPRGLLAAAGAGQGLLPPIPIGMEAVGSIMARSSAAAEAGEGGAAAGAGSEGEEEEEEAEQVDSRDFVSRLMAEWSWRQTERHLRHFVNAIAALVCAAICMGFMLLVKGMALWQQVLVSLAVGACVWLCIYLVEHLRKRWGRRAPVSSSA